MCINIYKCIYINVCIYIYTHLYPREVPPLQKHGARPEPARVVLHISIKHFFALCKVTLGFRVSDFGFWVCTARGPSLVSVPGFGSRFSVFGSRISGLGFRVSDLGLRVSGFGFRGSDLTFRSLGLGFWVSDLGLRVSGFGFGGWITARARERERE